MGTFSIRIMNADRRPISGAGVMVDYGMWHGTATEYTDEDGWATFSNQDGDLVSGDFFARGVSLGTHSTRSGETYSFTI
jgi:hypothetical protein